MKKSKDKNAMDLRNTYDDIKTGSTRASHVSMPLGMWWMLLSRTPCGALHVFLVHEASVEIV